ncbi:MAG: MscL family protein [Leptolyngbya sp. SIO3F4]|nr:MscL family protein [Leptolyngbya sp. SIO3F4]
MPVINYGNLFSSLFTWLKLGASLFVLVILVNKLVEEWQNTPQTLEQQNQTIEAISDNAKHLIEKSSKKVAKYL